MSTPNMNLQLPVPTVTLGPTYATENNTAFETIDLHDHTSGKGVPITPAGIDINTALDFQGYKAFDLFSTQYSPVATPLTGASNANSVSVSGGNLYFTNGAGSSVQITSGGSIVTSPGSVETLEYDTVSSNLVIANTDAFVFLSIDTTSSRTITLPLASSVAEGRIYVMKDATGDSNANPLTIARSGADLIDDEVSLIIQSNYASVWLISDGVSSWRVF